jgi:hypothetical protein
MSIAYTLETFDDLSKRLPVLEVILKNLGCSDAEKKLLKDLFLEVYAVAFEDGARNGG